MRSAALAAGHFAEFRDWAVMDEDFAALVDQLLKKVSA